MTQPFFIMLLLLGSLVWGSVLQGHTMVCPPATGDLRYKLLDAGNELQAPPVDAQDWINFRGGSLDLNFTPKTLWVKIEWTSPAATEQKCILVVDYPFLDYLSLYEKKPEGWASQHTGDRTRDSDAIPYARHPAFVFTAHPGPNIIYLKARTTGLLRCRWECIRMKPAINLS